jgi:hypothetical protein
MVFIEATGLHGIELRSQVTMIQSKSPRQYSFTSKSGESRIYIYCILVYGYRRIMRRYKVEIGHKGHRIQGRVKKGIREARNTHLSLVEAIQTRDRAGKTRQDTNPRRKKKIASNGRQEG